MYCATQFVPQRTEYSPSTLPMGFWMHDRRREMSCFEDSRQHVILLCTPDTSLSAFYVLYSVCWPPVGPQDITT